MGWLAAAVVALLNPPSGSAQAAKNELIVVIVAGFGHLNQLYSKQPESDVFSPKKQAELAKRRAQRARFRPEAIMVEAERQEQPQLDSLYEWYRAGQPALTALPTGRSERYQVGFVLGVAPVGVQEELVAANPAYGVVHAAAYLKATASSKVLKQLACP